MKLRSLVAGALVAALLPATASAQSAGAPPRTEAVERVLYGAYNFNGPTTVVDGITFVDDRTVPAITAGPERACNTTEPITNAVPSTALESVLRCFVWGGYEIADPTNAKALSIAVSGVPDGSYEVTFWNWEENGEEVIQVVLEGNAVEQIYTSIGQWRLLGPYSVEVTDGTLNVGSINGALNISAMKIDRLVQPAPVVQPRAHFKPLTPTRVLDTRAGQLVNYTGGKPAAGAVVEVPVAGGAGVPASGVTAAVLNITAVDAGAAGFVTAYASGTVRPDVSNVNPMYAGHTVPNMAIVPVGANGRVSLFTLGSSHLVVDISGYFVSDTGTDGRYHAVTPNRVLDTRAETAVGYSGPKPASGATVKVPIHGKAGVPTTARAVAVTLTATESVGETFVTAYPSGQGRPLASNLNLPVTPNFTAANMAIVPIGADGSIELFTNNPLHLIVDIQGWFGDGSESEPGGFYVAQTPTRTADSRSSSRIGLPTGPYTPPNFLTPSLGLRPAGEQVAAVVFNMTTTSTPKAGFITAYPAGAGVPVASNLNAATADATVGAMSITRLGNGNAINVYHQVGGELILDVAGWFTAN